MEKTNSVQNSGAKTPSSSSTASGTSTSGATGGPSTDPGKEISEKDQLLEQYRRLRAREESLDREIANFLEEGVTDASQGLQPQMEALHVYNEMKDVTQMILGYLADVEQATVARLHKRYGLPLD